MLLGDRHAIERSRVRGDGIGGTERTMQYKESKLLTEHVADLPGTTNASPIVQLYKMRCFW